MFAFGRYQSRLVLILKRCNNREYRKLISKGFVRPNIESSLPGPGVVVGNEMRVFRSLVIENKSKFISEEQRRGYLIRYKALYTIPFITLLMIIFTFIVLGSIE